MAIAVKSKNKFEGDVASPLPDHLEKQRQEESRLVKGVFQDSEVRGGSVTFPFKKFKGDEIKMYSFVDGQEYEVPLAVVKHMNSGCFYEQDSYCKDLVTANGFPMKNPNPKRFHRFSFKVSEYT